MYNQFFTMHGTTMVFLVVMPMLIGFANYLVPLMIGARDMAFPRLNALSFWVLLFGGAAALLQLPRRGGAPAAGWFAYAPLSETALLARPRRRTTGSLGLLGIGIGTLAAGDQPHRRRHRLRAPGMTHPPRCRSSSG